MPQTIGKAADCGFGIGWCQSADELELAADFDSRADPAFARVDPDAGLLLGVLADVGVWSGEAAGFDVVAVGRRAAAVGASTCLRPDCALSPGAGRAVPPVEG